MSASLSDSDSIYIFIIIFKNFRCHDVCEKVSEVGGEIYIQFTLSPLSYVKCLPVFSKSEKAGDLPRPEKMINKYFDQLKLDISHNSEV